MEQILKILTFWLISIFSFNSISSIRKLSFVEYLNLAEKNDPDLSLIVVERERVKFLVDLGLPARQLLLQASREYGLSVFDNQDTVNTQASLSRNFLETGTNISLSYRNNDLADRTEEVSQVRLEQALIRNMFGKYTRLEKSALKDEAKSLSFQIVDTYEDYLRDLGDLYLNYAVAWHNVDLAKIILDETKNLLGNVRKMRKNNIASLADVNRAKLQVSLREEDLVNLQNNLETFGARLRASAKIENKQIEPDLSSFSVFLPKVQLDGIDYDSLRVAKIAKRNEEAAQKRVKLSRSLNDPELNLVLGYNVDESSRFGTLVNREEQVLGVQLDIPFGNTKFSALEQEASLENMKARLSSSAQKRNTKQQFESLKIRLKNSKKIMELNEQKVDLSKKVYGSDLKRYQYGSLPLDRLIEIKNEYALYRYQLFSSSASYYRLALEWLDLTDRFVEEIK